MDVSLDSLSRQAQGILDQIGFLFAELLDNVEILMYFFFAQLFFAVTSFIPMDEG